MSLLEAIILGLVQGFTEFLPVSSSGHLVIFQTVFNMGGGESHMTFDIFLHLGTLISVFIAFRKTVWGLITGFFSMMKKIFTGKYSYKSSPKYEKMIVLVLISLIPLFIVLPLQEYLEKAFSNILLVGFCLLFTAVFLILSDKLAKGKKDMDTAGAGDSLFVGAVQAVATLPGISRSGSTITAGLLRGFSREFAVEFSFIMSIPAILGATLLEIFDVAENGMDTPVLCCVAGAAVAAAVGILAIGLVRLLVTKNKFRYFGYYCAAAGLLSVILFFVL